MTRPENPPFSLADLASPQIVRGPAGEDVETEVVREYDRTPSEVAAGMPPSHETIVETKKSYEIAGPAPQDRGESQLPLTVN